MTKQLNFDRILCLLFTPANRPDRYGKVPASGADGIIIDLEDSVSLGEKDSARDTVVKYLKEKGAVGADRPFFTCLRINNIHTSAGLQDVLALKQSGIHPDVIAIPKVNSSAEVEILENHLAGTQGDIQFMAMIETGIGLQNADQIAKVSPRVRALVFGGADLAADIGAALEWEPMLYARSRIVQAAATAGIGAYDVPYLNLQDLSGLAPETEKAKALGYRGKLAIHPKHVPTVLSVFRPDASTVDGARRIVAAYEAAKGDASEIDGKMIDVPVYRAAQRVLTLTQSDRVTVARV